MSDSSEEEDLSKFREAVDLSFIKSIDEPKAEKKLSEKFLDTATHYNDVKVPVQLQNHIYSKISAIIDKKYEFVDIPQVKPKKKHKITGGIKLFTNSENYLSADDQMLDSATELHNYEARKLKKKSKKLSMQQKVDENVKVTSSAMSGDYILSKEETKFWKSRRKEKLFQYKSINNSNKLISLD